MAILFDSSTLDAAKDAGVPISVLVGILSVFGILAAMSAGKVKLSIYITTAACATLSILSLCFIFWFSTKEIYRWVDTKGLADWAANDEGWTDGRRPSSNYCDGDREGELAICWSNRREGWPANVNFSGTPGAGAWCTYKMKEKILIGQANGLAIGRVFICTKVSL